MGGAGEGTGEAGVGTGEVGVGTVFTCAEVSEDETRENRITKRVMRMALCFFSGLFILKFIFLQEDG
jgi:hypothetical protein